MVIVVVVVVVVVVAVVQMTPILQLQGSESYVASSSEISEGNVSGGMRNFSTKMAVILLSEKNFETSEAMWSTFLTAESDRFVTIFLFLWISNNQKLWRFWA